MKIRKLHILLLTALIAIGFTGCVDDDEVFNIGPKLEPGTPVEMSLSLSVPQPKESLSLGSRADAETAITRQIYDLYIFFFDEEPGKEGQLKSKFYFSSISANAETQCDPALSSNGSALIQRTGLGQGSIKHIHTSAGRTRIVALANVSVKGSANILTRLSQVTTYDELENMMVSTIDPSTGFHDFESELSLMSGYYCNDHQAHGDEHFTWCDLIREGHDGIVVIDAANLPGTVWLTPLQARVKFVIDGNGYVPEPEADGSAPGMEPGRFELTSWQVYNIPGQTPLFCKGYDETGESFTPVDVKPTITQIVNSKNSPYIFAPDELGANPQQPNPANCYAFGFFPADNHPGRPKNSIEFYGERAAWNGSSDKAETPPEQKNYINAPDNATYVVLRGHYTGASEVTEATGTSIKNVSADVTYTIFLGHNSGTDYNDFNTYRNVNYTYIVSIKGVNKITVDVNTSVDERPDGEGHVSVLDSSTEILDCHFEQRVVSISKRQILDAINAKTFRMMVDEPVMDVNKRTYQYFRMKDNGDYVVDANGKPVPATDDPDYALPYMAWVQFYRHTDAEIGRSYIPYTQPKSTGKLMDVKAFMDDLYAFAMDPDVAEDEHAYYTAYFDEYVYLDDDGNQIHPETKQTVTWHRLVGTDSRSFTMLGSTRFSPDHNSSYSTAGTAFTQRQMQTIYNPDAPGLERAWATECIEENIISFEGKLYTGVPHGAPGRYYNGQQNPEGGATRYGRQNVWRNIANRRFDDMIDPQTGYLKKINGNTTYYSECIGRNRDLNGNGVLDKDELRWYLPSIEQYQLLYVGMDGLTADVQLYNTEIESKNLYVHNGHTTYPFKHYMSSSGVKAWTEEGCSNSNMIWNNHDVGQIGAEMLYVRCVRDIGTDAARHDGVPWNISGKDGDGAEANAIYAAARFQSIYELIEDETQLGDHKHVACRVRLSNLNNAAVRVIPEQRERQGEVHTFKNKPMREIEIADELITSININQEELPKLEKEVVDDSECKTKFGQGWRLPTLPELIALKWAKPSLVGHNATRTRFYYSIMEYKQAGWDNYPGRVHVHTGGRFSLQEYAHPGYRYDLRCVRDYDPNIIDDASTSNTESGGSEPSAAPGRRVRRK